MGTATAIEIPTGAWSVDRVHSRVEFEVQHLGISKFRGSFSDYDARLVAGDNGIGVEGEAKAESVRVDDENLYGHLLSPEFFDAERYPVIGFRSTGFELTGDGEIEAAGELTIRGKTNEVKATGRIGGVGVGAGGQNVVAIELQAVVNRHDYGLGWNMDLPTGEKALGDEVTLTVHLELTEETS